MTPAPAALGFVAQDLPRTFTAMVSAGFDGHKEPWDAFWGQRYATLRDPDGNGVDLFAQLPA
jgi:uncharacterized glyoxalase superfamily protein PhnB